MKQMKFNEIMRRVSLICLLSFFGVVTASANRNQYSFKTTITVSPTGAGTAYADYTDQDNSGRATSSTASYTGTEKSWNLNNYGMTANPHLYATANTGYRFLRWEDSSGNSISQVRNISVSQEYDMSGARYNRVTFPLDFLGILAYRDYYTVSSFSYTARFALQGNVIARVANGQDNVGAANILEETLTPGATITLVASNINGSEFEGWSFDHWELNGRTVSTEKEIKVVVPTSSTTLTYIAYFVKANTEYYCFIRNKKTGKYLKLSDVKTYTKPSSTDNPVGSFNGSFTLVDNANNKAVSDPACVFIVTGTAKNGTVDKASLIAQGVSVGFIPNSQVIKDNDKGLTISPASTGAYLISANYRVTQSGQTADIPIYFRDNNGTPDLAGARTEYSEWELLELGNATISQYYFGAAPNAALVKDGKYYTTLYTTFPYQLQSGKAFYVNSESISPYGEEGEYRVICQEVANGTVPANAAVIIECEGTDVESNKIVPLPLNMSIPSLEDNYLTGHITLRDGKKYGDGEKYVLSIGSSTGLGFYKLKTGTAIPDNKAYANLPEESQAMLKKMTFSFGIDEMEEPLSEDYGTLTNLHEVAMPEDIAGATIYDLQGRKVKNPSQGVYIVNGKKFIIK